MHFESPAKIEQEPLLAPKLPQCAFVSPTSLLVYLRLVPIFVSLTFPYLS